MDPFNPPGADYYADLGLQQQATTQDIKTAFRKLAIVSHPDKLGPGQCDDAHEFRKVREAYECLIDPTKRAAYDATYYDLQNELTRFRLWQESQNLSAEEMAAKYEEEKKAERAERARQKSRQRAAQAQEEEEDRQWRADMERQRQTAERSQQAGEVSPSEQHRLRRERKRQEREREQKKKKFDELCEATKTAWDRLVIERNAVKKRVKQLEDAQDARLHRIRLERKTDLLLRMERALHAERSQQRAEIRLYGLRSRMNYQAAEICQKQVDLWRKQADLCRLRERLEWESLNDVRIRLSYRMVMKGYLRLEKIGHSIMMRERAMARAWDSTKGAWIKLRASLLPDSVPDMSKPTEEDEFIISKPCSHTRIKSTKSRSNDAPCRRCDTKWFFRCPRCHKTICMICQGEGTF